MVTVEPYLICFRMIPHSQETPPFMKRMDALMTENIRLLQGLVRQTLVSPTGATHRLREGGVASANCSSEGNPSSAFLLGRERGGGSASANCSSEVNPSSASMLGQERGGGSASASSSIHATSLVNGRPDVAAGTGSPKGAFFV